MTYYRTNSSLRELLFSFFIVYDVSEQWLLKVSTLELSKMQENLLSSDLWSLTSGCMCTYFWFLSYLRKIISNAKAKKQKKSIVQNPFSRGSILLTETREKSRCREGPWDILSQKHRFFCGFFFFSSKGDRKHSRYTKEANKLQHLQRERFNSKVKLKLNEGEKKRKINSFKRVQRDLTTSDGSG